MLRFIAPLLLVSVAIGFSPSRSYGPGGRIVGGSDTSITNYPYQVSVQYEGSHSCGGSIISAEFILTAAHCFYDRDAAYSVRVGSSVRDAGGAVLDVAERLIHPLYEDGGGSEDYDVALLRLRAPIAFSAAAQPVALAARGEEVRAGTPAVVTGWGLLKSGGSLATVLQEVEVPVVSPEDCNNVYWGSITPRMLCAGYPEGGRDACSSDSGGPLVANGKQIGIVSWGSGCALPNVPGVYANVAALREWIFQNSGV